MAAACPIGRDCSGNIAGGHDGGRDHGVSLTGVKISRGNTFYRANPPEETLRAAGGYGVTWQCRAILDHLASADPHPGATDVFYKVGKTHPGVSLAIVYNVLGILVRS